MMDGNLVTAAAPGRPRRSAFAAAAWLLWGASVVVVAGAVVLGAVHAARPGGGDYESLAIILAPAKAAPYFGGLNLLGAIAGVISLVGPGRGAPIPLALNAVGVLLALYVFAIHLAP